MVVNDAIGSFAVAASLSNKFLQMSSLPDFDCDFHVVAVVVSKHSCRQIY
jgi:hypothetical protein